MIREEFDSGEKKTEEDGRSGTGDDDFPWDKKINLALIAKWCRGGRRKRNKNREE